MNKKIPTMNLVVVAFCVVIMFVVALAACSNDEKGLGDAPVKQTPDSTIVVIPNGDTFPNQAIICDGKTGVYTNTRDGNTTVIPNSVHCGGGAQ